MIDPGESQPNDAPAPPATGLSRNVYVLGIVSLFADISGEMVYPIVPLFLRTTLGAPVLAVGLIEGVAESTASLLKFLFGWLSDRVERRVPFTFAGYALAAVAKPLLALAYAWPFVLFARFVDRAGKGIRTAPRDALIADSSGAASRGRAFGLHRSMDTTGAILGPLLALLLLAWFGDGSYRLIFLVAGVPSAIAVVLVLAVREVRRPPRDGPRPPLLSLRGYDQRFLAFTGVMLLFAAGNSSDAFLVLRSRNLGLGATAVVFAYVLYNISYAALSLPAGIHSDRIGRKPVLVTGLLVFAGVYAGFAAARDAWAVWPLFIVYGAYIAFTEGIARAHVADLVPPERRGSAMGLYNAGLGVMLLVSSIVGGALWDLIGPAATFTFGASTAALAAVALLVLPGGSIGAGAKPR
ncbi:MAG TPA: MFS transporter [Dehalococcoidia bacterium]|nr:MFS transporter [Dehalococcoidia bacterium]